MKGSAYKTNRIASDAECVHLTGPYAVAKVGNRNLYAVLMLKPSAMLRLGLDSSARLAVAFFSASDLRDDDFLVWDWDDSARPNKILLRLTSVVQPNGRAAVKIATMNRGRVYDEHLYSGRPEEAVAAFLRQQLQGDFS